LHLITFIQAGLLAWGIVAREWNIEVSHEKTAYVICWSINITVDAAVGTGRTHQYQHG
jgi:urease accessory protein UreF